MWACSLAGRLPDMHPISDLSAEPGAYKGKLFIGNGVTLKCSEGAILALVVEAGNDRCVGVVIDGTASWPRGSYIAFTRNQVQSACQRVSFDLTRGMAQDVATRLVFDVCEAHEGDNEIKVLMRAEQKRRREPASIRESLDASFLVAAAYTEILGLRRALELH